MWGISTVSTCLGHRHLKRLLPLINMWLLDLIDLEMAFLYIRCCLWILAVQDHHSHPCKWSFEANLSGCWCPCGGKGHPGWHQNQPQTDAALYLLTTHGHWRPVKPVSPYIIRPISLSVPADGWLTALWSRPLFSSNLVGVNQYKIPSLVVCASVLGSGFCILLVKQGKRYSYSVPRLLRDSQTRCGPFVLQLQSPFQNCCTLI